MEEQLRGILDDVAGLIVPAARLSPTQDLFAVGLTSFATVTVMLALEEGFDVEFPDSLLTRDTFRSLSALMAAITSLRDDSLVA